MSTDKAGAVSDGLMDIREVAKFLSVGRSTVYVLMDEGRLPFAKIGRARRIPRRAVIDYAAAQLRGGGLHG
jgi:excisionase family DNA binding protein